MVPQGSTVNYWASWTTVPLTGSSVATVMALVSEYLQSDQWNLAVLSFNAVEDSTLSGRRTVSMVIQTGSAFNSPDDIKAILDGAFYNAPPSGADLLSAAIPPLLGNAAALGITISSSAITSWTDSSGATQQTGAPPAAPSNTTAATNSTGIFGTLFGTLSTSTKLIGGVVILGGLLIIVLAYGGSATEIRKAVTG